MTSVFLPRHRLPAASALLLLTLAPTGLDAQWEPGTCYCVTYTKTVPITFLGLKVGEKEVTVTECYY